MTQGSRVENEDLVHLLSIVIHCYWIANKSFIVAIYSAHWLLQARKCLSDREK